MTVNAGRWRRMDSALHELSEARFSPDAGKCPDAVVRALDSLNDLWNGYHVTRKSVHVGPRLSQDDVVAGQPGGETAAALVFARGEKTHHDLLEFGDLTDTYSDTYSDIYGVWRWQRYPGTAKYQRRFEWYSRHVEGEEVLPPFTRALEWLEAQPEVEREGR